MSLVQRFEEPNSIRSYVGYIFVSLELSRSTWLITSLSPGSGEKMSKYGILAGDLAALLARFSGLKQKAFARTGKSFSIVVIQEAGLDGFWIHRVLQSEGIRRRATWSIRPRLRRHAGGGEPRPIGLMARHWSVRCWLTNGANRASAPSSARRRPKTKTIAGFAVSARR